VLQVGGAGSPPPVAAADRRAYCAYLASVLRTHPSIRDVVVWTEPNQPTFWPVPNARAYVSLLARCWDAAHAVRADANVVASTGPHARIPGAVAPASWYAQLGAAYRASGRHKRLFDTLGHNVYPDTPDEPAAARHPGPSIDEGDYDRLMAVLSSAFRGTGQPLPGRGGVTIWYLEDGFETTVGDHLAAYTGSEIVSLLLSPEQQASQLDAAIRLAYCQPYVGAFFNFQLADDSSLAGWQSGLLYADGVPKPSYDVFRGAAAAAHSGTISCV
jgi:hypothetical protein